MADETDDGSQEAARDATRKSGAKKSAAKKSGAKKSTAKKSAAKVSGDGGRLPGPAEVPRPWLESYPPDVPTTYPHPRVPLTRLLDDAAIDFPGNEAVHFRGASMTYRQLLDEVDRLASALAGLGVVKGDRVGLILPSCPQHVVAIFATLRLGAVVVEHDPTGAGDELAEQISDAACRVVVCLDPIYPRLAGIRARLPSVEHVIVTGIQDALPFPKNRLFPLRGRRDGTYQRIPADERVLRLHELIRRTAPAPPPVEVDAGEDPAMLLYTGGTTGPGKAVVLTHANLVANAFQVRLWLPDIRAGAENLLCVLPLCHAYGMTACLGLGVLTAATLTLSPRSDAEAVLEVIDERRPTLLPGTPAMYAALCEARRVGEHDLSSLRVCLSGAAPLSEDVAAELERHTGARPREVYGLTEAGAVTHANPIHGRSKAGSVGLPLVDTVCTLRAVDDPTAPAPANGPGELAIAGPQVMAGYWNRPEATRAALVDGWVLTGDLATVDDEGYVFIVGRKAERIVVGDHDVHPREVERALSEHPEVRRAAVVGVPDAHHGHKVKAYVVLDDGAELTDDGLLGFLGQRLAPHELPRQIEFRGGLPEDALGRVRRRRLASEEPGSAA